MQDETLQNIDTLFLDHRSETAQSTEVDAIQLWTCEICGALCGRQGILKHFAWHSAIDKGEVR